MMVSATGSVSVNVTWFSRMQSWFLVATRRLTHGSLSMPDMQYDTEAKPS